MAKIVIDAGHGGFDNGARYQGRKEKDDNLNLALAVGKLLEQKGYDVIFTRETDVYQSPYEKAQMANEAGADYLISFHRNAAEQDNTYNGVQTLIYGGEDMRARRLAEAINDALEQLGFSNQGVEERKNLAVLHQTRMPAVLIETGFIDNDKDNRIYDERFDEIAAAIAGAVEELVPLGQNTASQERRPGDLSGVQAGDDSASSEPGMDARRRERPDSAGDNGFSSDPGMDTRRRERPDSAGDNGSSSDPGMDTRRRERPEPDGDTDGNDPDGRDVVVFGVETGRFGYHTTAQFLADQLEDQGFFSYVYEDDGIFHVVVGKEDSIEDAQKLERQLRNMGYQTLIIARKK